MSYYYVACAPGVEDDWCVFWTNGKRTKLIKYCRADRERAYRIWDAIVELRHP